MAKTTRTLPQAFRHYLANPLALGYLGVVLAVCVWVAVDTFSAASSGDASFAGVWAILATAPTSLLFTFLFAFAGPVGPVGLIGIPIGAVAQAFALGALYRHITERRTHGTANGATSA
ncbi:SCO4225 family membrane protein [Streptomyces cyaneofuscatus]|uniref:SCO4225 family membrane protein n=1 Tax=Streptomyces cyaneofuscatus TaxID=66883 RepID=UPI00339EB941